MVLLNLDIISLLIGHRFPNSSGKAALLTRQCEGIALHIHSINGNPQRNLHIFFWVWAA
jgi:hypothetical protein